MIIAFSFYPLLFEHSKTKNYLNILFTYIVNSNNPIINNYFFVLLRKFYEMNIIIQNSFFMMDRIEIKLFVIWVFSWRTFFNLQFKLSHFNDEEYLLLMKSWKK